MGLSFVTLLYIYISFIILQLSLFNIILLGILATYFKSLVSTLRSFEYKMDYNFKVSHFNSYIKKVNKEIFKPKNIDLVGGEKGLWLEVHLCIVKLA